MLTLMMMTLMTLMTLMMMMMMMHQNWTTGETRYSGTTLEEAK